MVYGAVASLLQTLDYLIHLLFLFSEISEIRIRHFLTTLEEEKRTTEPLRLFSHKFESFPTLRYILTYQPVLGMAREIEYKFFHLVGQMSLDNLSILSTLLHQSREQRLTQGQCSFSAATNPEKHLMMLLYPLTQVQCSFSAAPNPKMLLDPLYSWPWAQMFSTDESSSSAANNQEKAMEFLYKLQPSWKQPLSQGECSSSGATNQEKQLMEILDGIEMLRATARPLKDCFVENAVNYLWESHHNNVVIHLFREVYNDLAFLYGDLQFLVSYLGDSWDIDESQLKYVMEVSDRVKHVIEKSIEHSQIELTMKLRSSKLMNGVQVDPLDLYKNLPIPIGIEGFKRILRCLQRSREEINCIKAEILETKSKQRYINDQLPSPKLPQRDSKQEILVAFGDEELFLEELVNSATQPGLQVLTIVGMGGIGKTTLAKQLFNHPYVVYHFDCLSWITVSQGYDIRDLLLALLNSLAHKSDDLIDMTNAELAESVYRSLKCKRYLIVMDDMWATKAWNDVKRCFPDDKTGSRILITSRLVGIANHVSPNKPPHFMNLFDAEHSWELLEKLVCKNAACSPQFEEVGRQIAKRCCGLPLAIVVVSGVLCNTPMTLESWSKIAENLSSIVVKDPEQCLDILALSYVFLPYRLRACFLYMGAFPDDCEIEVQKLINLWVAEGFFHSKSQGNLEQIAENFLEDLIGRNLVMVEKRKTCGEVKTCRLHDIVKEFCLREAQKEGFMNVVGRQISKNVPAGQRYQRRLSFHLDPFCGVSAPPALPYISSFLCFSLGSNIVCDILFFQFGFKLLRVLDIYFLCFEYFPEVVPTLVHLRYLALNVTYQLPETMSELRNLQTFVIQGPWLNQAFMLEYWRMPSLRHLHTSVPIVLMEPLREQFDLQTLLAPKYLQTVSVLRFLSCKRSVLMHMQSLKGLRICETKDDYSNDSSCDLLNNLVHLQELEILKCCFYAQNKSPRQISCLDSFPATLRQLSLSWSYMPWEDMTIIARLHNLDALKLKNYAFQGPKWLLTGNGFPRLKYLVIDNTDLVHWEATVSQFPCLQKLILKRCKNLEEIPFGVDAIGALQQMEVHCCSISMDVLAQAFQEQVEGVNVVIRTDHSQQNAHAEGLVHVKLGELNVPY